MARRKFSAPVDDQPVERGPKNRFKIKQVKANQFGEYDLLDTSLPKEISWLETFKTYAEAETEMRNRMAAVAR